MSVQELSSQLGISLPKAYELVKSEAFRPSVSARGSSFPLTLFGSGWSSLQTSRSERRENNAERG